MDIIKNTAAEHVKAPALSVLIPYYHDNPANLLTAIGNNINIEILIYDDGTRDKTINDNLQAIAIDMDAPVTLFFAHENKGRSSARNTLKSYAKAEWVLFLDADMLPETNTFIADYLEAIAEGNADILFGGFTVADHKQTNETELHRAFSQTSDCLSAAERTKNGPQYVCSSNLCVRSKVLDECGFDSSFVGWGWEDSEWAARVAKAYTIRHVDIPALHLGLESTETLLSRFKTSGANYVKFTNAHPELAKTLPLYKISHKLKRLPGQKLMRPVLSGLVRTSMLPTKFRLIALKLWRASWYAEAFS